MNFTWPFRGPLILWTDNRIICTFMSLNYLNRHFLPREYFAVFVSWLESVLLWQPYRNNWMINFHWMGSYLRRLINQIIIDVLGSKTLPVQNSNWSNFFLVAKLERKCLKENKVNFWNEFEKCWNGELDKIKILIICMFWSRWSPIN